MHTWAQQWDDAHQRIGQCKAYFEQTEAEIEPWPALPFRLMAEEAETPKFIVQADDLMYVGRNVFVGNKEDLQCFDIPDDGDAD